MFEENCLEGGLGAIAMSQRRQRRRWPPEIAGTIGLSAGRSPVAAERVPIFYSRFTLGEAVASDPLENILCICAIRTSRLGENGPVREPRSSQEKEVLKRWEENGRTQKRSRTSTTRRLIFTELLPETPPPYQRIFLFSAQGKSDAMNEITSERKFSRSKSFFIAQTERFYLSRFQKRRHKDRCKLRFNRP